MVDTRAKRIKEGKRERRRERERGGGGGGGWEKLIYNGQRFASKRKVKTSKIFTENV